jgi:hypothetical protein
MSKWALRIKKLGSVGCRMFGGASIAEAGGEHKLTLGI